MNLLAIRKKLVELTGHVHLVKDTTRYQDNGADFHIQSGQRLLDGLLDFPKSKALVSRKLEIGENILILPRFRAVQSVWIHADEGIRFLARVTPEALERRFPGDKISNGLPTHYALEYMRSIGGQNDQDKSWNQLRIMVPPDRQITIKVSGLFSSDHLAEDEDTSFWSLEYPETLLNAAMYSIERFYRNTQGMADHMNAIMQDVNAIDADVVEEEIAGQDQMEDSFDERVRRTRRNYGKIW